MGKGQEALRCTSALVVVTFGHEVPHGGPERLKDALYEGGVERDAAGALTPAAELLRLRKSHLLLGAGQAASRASPCRTVLRRETLLRSTYLACVPA